jgi:hypothetical protein
MNVESIAGVDYTLGLKRIKGELTILVVDGPETEPQNDGGHVWDGHSCPPPLTLTLFSQGKVRSLLKSRGRRRSAKTNSNFNGVGQECPPHTSVSGPQIVEAIFLSPKQHNRSKIFRVDAAFGQQTL